jgi:hypothetical protein
VRYVLGKYPHCRNSVLVPEARISGRWPERLFEAGVFGKSVLTVGFEPTLAAV